ncbi:MAG TPA: calcium-binding protein [Nocardioidaceae bacterium]|nr:calcium-binding protein [Nocardioidaceae bacterium]
MASVAPRRGLLVLALVAGLVSAVPHDAAVAAAPSTATGVRCTVVGTPGPDLLVGTAGPDVICGLGGNDRIRARAGDDLVDGGPGRDRILGGAGVDRVLGGAGADELLGGNGRDRISAGRGRDLVKGGDGADVLEGGSEGDELDGNGGDDELVGGPGADDVDGGLGDNLCIVDAEDESIRCRYDEQPPAYAEVTVEPGVADVTLEDATLTVRARLTDDTGLRHVTGWLHAGETWISLDWFEQVSGTDRDGLWKASVTLPRYSPAGSYALRLHVVDRQGRTTTEEVPGVAVEVANTDPDTVPPVIMLLSVTPAVVDVRTASRDVTVEVRATDAKSGVARLDICLSRPGTPTPYLAHPLHQEVDCAEAVARKSGSAQDGVYRALLTVPQGSVGATYNVVTYAEDRLGNHARYMGPEAYEQWTLGNWCCSAAYAFPDGGRVTVTGAPADVTPAWVESVTVSTTQLVTLAGDDSTHVGVRVRDAQGEGEGVTQVQALLVAHESLTTDPQFSFTELTLTSGTVNDGWWEGDVVAPQGTPPGTYHLLISIADRAHAAIYTDPTAPGADGVTYQPLAGIPVITVVDAR